MTYQAFSEPNLKFKERINLIFPPQQIYPFLRHWTALPFFLLLGSSPQVAIFSNLFYLFILIFSLYGIGKILDSELTGLVASFLVSFYPGIFGFSRVYMLDFPITALVTLSIFLMLKSNYFQNKKCNFLLGLSIAIGLLHKQTFLIHFFGPFLIYFLQSIFRFKRINLWQIVFILTIPLIIILPWYLTNYSGQLSFLNAGRGINLSNLYTFTILNPIQFQLYPLITIIFYFCLFLYFLKPHYRAIMLAWLSFPVLFYLFFTFEDFPRHTLPVLPATGIVITYVLNHLSEYLNINKDKFKKTQPVIIVILYIFCTLQFFLANYKKSKDKFDTLDFDFRVHRIGILYPRRFDYSESIEEIVNLISQEKKTLILGLDIPTEFNEFIRFEITKRNLKKIILKNLLFSFAWQKDGEGKANVFFKSQEFDYLLIPEPIEKYADTLLCYEQLRTAKFNHQLSFFYALFLKGKDRKISFKEARDLFFQLAKDVEKYKDDFKLIRKIILPRHIFRSPYPRFYYLYRRINP
ncbi:MAG: phospholipid carrier-dependent glycosyltransferase [Candidatus Omnitrophica bacterium]|nr:phospholipid carrier-dependent glycosyltransferase [Candidatus Omnitrophota bacterium]